MKKIIKCPLCDEIMNEQEFGFWKCPNCGCEVWPEDEEKTVYITDSRQNLHEKEKRLLEFIRRLGYGELVIKVQDGLPVMIEKATEKVKL